MPDVTAQRRVEIILQQLEELPTLPAVAMRLLEVVGDSTASARHVGNIISADPTLTAKVLQLVHRSDVGVRGEITSVDRAVVLLGFESVRAMTLAVSVFQTFSPASPTGTQIAFDRAEFWKHCLAVGCAAELLAVQLNARTTRENRVESADAFVCGLVHDLGKVALDAILPKSFARVIEAADLLRGNIADVERSVIGLDHMVIGKRLAERWQLPTSIRESIWLHGQLPTALPATVQNPRLVNLVSLADLLVRERHIGYSGNYVFAAPAQIFRDALGLTAEQVDTAMKGLVGSLESRAHTLGLGSTSSSELYQQALAQANKELGKVSGQLASKNRKLAIRAKFFDALAEFQGELRPDAPPQVVLQAIGQTAVGVLGATTCAAFSWPPGRDFAEAVLVDREGELVESTVIDCGSPEQRDAQRAVHHDVKDVVHTDSTEPVRRPARLDGDGPVLNVGDDLEWFLAAISPKLSHDNRYWICLEADGVCIGGVVWGAGTGESQRLGSQVQELSALAAGWGLALRTTQIREESRQLAEQLAEANRRLQSAQIELLRTRTLSVVGEMAAGAAHEMNNPLAVISGRSQLLSMQLTDPKQKAAAHLVFEQSHRLSEIITELMSFAKPTPPTIKTCAIGELLQHAIERAKVALDPADRTFEVAVGEVPEVACDIEQVTAAVCEVIQNALLATNPQSGVIRMSAAFDPFSSKVVLTIADNGSGMDEATLKRAFDPFFSAQTAGRRRGLGLAKALRWVESSGGSIRLESQTGVGTRAIVLLPPASSKSVET